MRVKMELYDPQPESENVDPDPSLIVKVELSPSLVNIENRDDDADHVPYFRQIVQVVRHSFPTERGMKVKIVPSLDTGHLFVTISGRQSLFGKYYVGEGNTPEAKIAEYVRWVFGSGAEDGWNVDVEVDGEMHELDLYLREVSVFKEVYRAGAED